MKRERKILFFAWMLSLIFGSLHADQDELGFTPYKGIYGSFSISDDREGATQVMLHGGYKYKLLDNSNFYFAYSVDMFWDVEEVSSPFYDINHNPELFWQTTKRWLPFFTKYLTYTKVGYEHISNGVDNTSTGKNGVVDRSRSINNLNTEFDITLSEHWKVTPKIWWFFSVDDNHDVEDYYGNIDVRVEYKNNDFIYGANLRGNPKTGYGRVLLDFSLPATWPVKNSNMYYYVQYFNGYGESLLDYNRYVQTVRIGLMLARK